MPTWIFQGNPDTFDVTGYVRSTPEILWTVQQRHLRDRMLPGDRVFIWSASGRGRGTGGVVAEGVLTAAPSLMPVDPQSSAFWSGAPQPVAMRVPARVLKTANEKEIIRREWLREDPVLSDLRILHLATETNYELSPAHADRLQALWTNTGRDWDRRETIAGLWAFQMTLGQPVSRLPGSPVADVSLLIGRAVQGVYNKVMNFRAIDPTDEREGFSGGGEMATVVWSEFFDTTTRRLNAGLLLAEFDRLWPGFQASASPRIDPSPSLTVLVDTSEIRAAQEAMNRVLQRGARSLGRHQIGFRGGSVEADVYHRADLDLWFASEQEQNRYWTAFGFGRPQSRFTDSIVTEINSPFQGINRSIAGAFARDQEGGIYIVHRGKVGGGRKGISKSSFLRYYRQGGGALELIRDGDREASVVVICSVEDRQLPALVASFVHSVRKFKEHATTDVSAESPPTDHAHVSNRFSEEFSGTKQYSTRDRIEAQCTHGTIVNSLYRELEGWGLHVSNDKFRDLVVTSDAGIVDGVFEVKPTDDPYHVYQAIGQLLLHTLDHPGARRVAVLPADTDEATRDSLRRLGIMFVGFEWVGQGLIFHGLEEATGK